MNRYIPNITPLGNTLDILEPNQSMRMLVEEFPYTRSVPGYIYSFFRDRKSDKKFKVKFLDRDRGYSILRVR